MSHKSGILFVAVIVLAASTVCGEENAWKTYQNEYEHADESKTAFSLDIPSGWEVLEYRDLGQGDLRIVKFMSYPENPDDPYRERIALQIEDPWSLPRPPLQCFITPQRIDLHKISANSKKLEEGKITIAGYEGTYAVYLEFNDRWQRYLKHKSYVFIIPETETVYTFLYSAAPKGYDRFLPTAEKIIKSFKVWITDK